MRYLFSCCDQYARVTLGPFAFLSIEVKTCVFCCLLCATAGMLCLGEPVVGFAGAPSWGAVFLLVARYLV